MVLKNPEIFYILNRLDVKKHEVLRRSHFEILLESEQVFKYSGISISNLCFPFNIN